jgi:hypothetical protein
VRARRQLNRGYLCETFEEPPKGSIVIELRPSIDNSVGRVVLAWVWADISHMFADRPPVLVVPMHRDLSYLYGQETDHSIVRTDPGTSRVIAAQSSTIYRRLPVFILEGLAADLVIAVN